MASIRWTVGARRDLEAIFEFIATDSPTYAAAIATEIVGAVDQLRRYPRSGRAVPELKNPEIRELIVGNYRVVYRVQRRQTGILAIIHGRRDLLRAFRGRE